MTGQNTDTEVPGTQSLGAAEEMDDRTDILGQVAVVIVVRDPDDGIHVVSAVDPELPMRLSIWL
jgi:hypothetical protein